MQKSLESIDFDALSFHAAQALEAAIKVEKELGKQLDIALENIGYTREQYQEKKPAAGFTPKLIDLVNKIYFLHLGIQVFMNEAEEVPSGLGGEIDDAFAEAVEETQRIHAVLLTTGRSYERRL